MGEESIIGKSVPRVDALDKVTGAARYTADLCPPGALVARILHSSIANGRVKRIDTAAAAAMPGVELVVTCFDVPDIAFPTAGHPWSVESAHQDVADRRLLNSRVRYFGDEIAAVVAVDEVTAERACRAIEVEYEEYPPYLTVEQAMAADAMPLHPEICPGNVLKEHSYSSGDLAAAQAEPGLLHLHRVYRTQPVQHCHIEPAVSFAYGEGGKIVVVSATQIPHIMRRVVGQALGLPWGQVHIIKPYLGGGFGNRQDVLYEPLNAYLSQRLNGRCVLLEASREEVFACTRQRHAITFSYHAWARPDGTLVARDITAWSQQGGYASHGHAIVANATTFLRDIYQDEQALATKAYTVYTNTGAGGAMRGYGIPQGCFAADCMMDDLAQALGLDPILIREKNMMRPGFVDPGTGIACQSYGLADCIRRGRELSDWDRLRRAYAQQSGPLRRGIGMAIFTYKTGVYPISLETASCRMVLNQDGTLQLHLGATEIGQGGDTVFLQMASAATGIPFADIHIVSTQDTDIAPFDTGAYASRQTYVTGKAIKKTGGLLREKLFAYAARLLGCDAAQLQLCGRQIVSAAGEPLISLADLAQNAFYGLDYSEHITAEATSHCADNTFAFGCCFAEIEVDLPLGRIRPLKVINVHDSGVLINPQLAEAQVHGGQSMGLGYALSEEMLYDEKGRLRNGNLLDYKLPTALDTPPLCVDFVQTVDPSGPFGNKALGEPPAIPVAPAIRNALLHATGVAVDELPLEPKRLVRLFQERGLI